MEKLDKIDASRRQTLSTLMKTVAFAGPLMASFAMGGLSPAEAAIPGNSNVDTLSDWAIPVAVTGLAVLGVATIAKAKEASE